jgi:hypothetical protein
MSTAVMRYTLNTNHSRMSPRSEVADDVLETMRPLLTPGEHDLGEMAAAQGWRRVEPWSLAGEAVSKGVHERRIHAGACTVGQGNCPPGVWRSVKEQFRSRGHGKISFRVILWSVRLR